MTNKERFFNLRRRTFELIKTELEIDGYCKPYEGAIDVLRSYPNYFEDESGNSPPAGYCITLHCYVLGGQRHYDFIGRTFDDALDKFEGQIVEWENRHKRSSLK